MQSWYNLRNQHNRSPLNLHLQFQGTLLAVVQQQTLDKSSIPSSLNYKMLLAHLMLEMVTCSVIKSLTAFGCLQSTASLSFYDNNNSCYLKTFTDCMNDCPLILMHDLDCLLQKFAKIPQPPLEVHLQKLFLSDFFLNYYCIEPICAAVTNVRNYNCTGSIHLSGLLNNPFEIQHTF